MDEGEWSRCCSHVRRSHPETNRQKSYIGDCNLKSVKNCLVSFFYSCLISFFIPVYIFPILLLASFFTKTVCVARNKNGLGSSLLVKLRQHFILFYSYMFDCFVYMYVCIPHMCLVLSHVRWGCYIPGTNCYESPFGLWKTKWVFHKSYPCLKCRAIFFHLRERDPLCLSSYVHPFFL